MIARRLSKFLFRFYQVSLVLLMLIKTKGTIELSSTILGIRTDYFIHACLFVPFMGLWWFWKRFQFRRQLVLNSFVQGILFAAFCESLHLLVPYRTFSIFDFFANCFGLTFGYLMLRIVVGLFLAPKSN